jgi:hypothetical protein
MAKKYLALPKIYEQMKSVFEQKCHGIDITKDECLAFLPHIPTRSSKEPLMKTSLLYDDSFNRETKHKGKTLWNSFKPVKES